MMRRAVMAAILALLVSPATACIMSRVGGGSSIHILSMDCGPEHGSGMISANPIKGRFEGKLFGSSLFREPKPVIVIPNDLARPLDQEYLCRLSAARVICTDPLVRP